MCKPTMFQRTPFHTKLGVHLPFVSDSSYNCVTIETPNKLQMLLLNGFPLFAPFGNLTSPLFYPFFLQTIAECYLFTT